MASLREGVFDWLTVYRYAGWVALAPLQHLFRLISEVLSLVLHYEYLNSI
jgi:hypothetical protein